LEGLVFAERVARDIVSVDELRTPPKAAAWEVPPLADRGAAQVAAESIRSVMWEYASIDRTAKGLRQCLAALDEIEARLPAGATEEENMVLTARLIAEAALLRKESRGGHYRSDFPTAKKAWRGKHIEF
ncbi:MAG TPA: hypothetical protein VF771_20795, partial [Longimicrobiaceae bacterium]